MYKSFKKYKGFFTLVVMIISFETTRIDNIKKTEDKFQVVKANICSKLWYQENWKNEHYLHILIKYGWSELQLNHVQSSVLI